MPTLSQAHFEMGRNEATVDTILKLLSSGMELDKIYSILEPSDEIKEIIEEKLKDAGN